MRRYVGPAGPSVLENKVAARTDIVLSASRPDSDKTAAAQAQAPGSAGRGRRARASVMCGVNGRGEGSTRAASATPSARRSNAAVSLASVAHTIAARLGEGTQRTCDSESSKGSVARETALKRSTSSSSEGSGTGPRKASVMCRSPGATTFSPAHDGSE